MPYLDSVIQTLEFSYISNRLRYYTLNFVLCSNIFDMLTYVNHVSCVIMNKIGINMIDYHNMQYALVCREKAKSLTTESIV